MALKRINKELTDLGRYELSPTLPVLASLSAARMTTCESGALQRETTPEARDDLAFRIFG